MSLEVQLNALLEMLDLTSAMKSSPSRSKRLKLLKKTISDVRLEMSQKTACPPSEQSPSPENTSLPVPECLEEGAHFKKKKKIFTLPRFKRHIVHFQETLKIYSEVYSSLWVFLFHS